ncbi:MAG: Gfo/Idh/MocA family oxidoreductase, partial [Aggregatilineales bacterium]
EYQSDWRHTLAAGGGVMMDMIHLMYLVEWIMGAPAQQVMAFVDAPVYQQRAPQIEDTGLFQMAFPTGYAQVNLGWGEGAGGAQVSGATGQIHMRYRKHQTAGFNQPVELYTVKDWERDDHPIQNAENHDSHIGGSFTRLWEDFLQACEDGREPIASAKAGYRALQLTLAGYLSGATGRTIQLPLPADHPVYQQGIAGMKDVDIWEHSRTTKAGIFGLRGD